MAKTTWEAQAKYDKANTISFSVKLNKKYDSDVISWLEKQTEPRQAYLKRIIREDLARTGSVPENTDSVPEQSYSVPKSFKDPFADTIAESIGTWIDRASSILSDERPYIVPDSVPKKADCVSVPFSPAAMSILAEKAAEKGLSVPDLVSVMVNEQLIRTR